MAGMQIVNRREMLKFNLMIASVVWAAWYFIGGDLALASIAKNWIISVTMAFGSTIGGGTSEGSGAVAFPVFTKLLHIPPQEARVFAFAIQSVGMTCATLSILYNRIKIEWRVLPFAALGGMTGVTFSTFYLLPVVSPALVKICFTVMLTSLAISLLIVNRGSKVERHDCLPVYGTREKLMFVAAGLCGGMISGMVGCGDNIVTFMLLVLLFRVNEKVATPTTIALMTMVTLYGFALHSLVVGDFTPTVRGYWLAAVPVSCVAGPFGAFLFSLMSRKLVVNLLITLISIEFVTTLFLVHMSPQVALTALTTLAAIGYANWRMCRIDIYAPKAAAVANDDKFMAAPVLAYARVKA